MSGLVLVLLAACQPHPESKPGDSVSGESGPVDTGTSDTDTGVVDSVDSEDSRETADTGDTHHTGETAETGETGDTSVEPPPCDRSLAWKYVAAGWYSTCGIHTDGCAECWGRGLADDNPDWDTAAYQYEGEDRPPPGDYVMLDMLVSSPYDGFGQHACGILSSGEAVCWGEDTYGETTAPVGDYVDLAFWSMATLAVARDGTMVSWGIEPPFPGDDYLKVAVGKYYEYALTEGGAVVASSGSGELDLPAPAGTFINIDVEDHGCGVQTDGSLLCWDPEEPENAAHAYLTEVAPVGVFEQVCLGIENTACAVDVDGAIQCWGTAGDMNLVPEGYTFSQVACGYFHVCALTTDGQIVCWGLDFFGETIPPT